MITFFRFTFFLLLFAWTVAGASESNNTQAHDLWAGGAAPVMVTWRTNSLNVSKDGKLLLSFEEIAEADWRQVLRISKKQHTAATFEASYSVLSTVGPLLSLQEGSFCECGGAHSEAVKHYRAYDLDKSSPGHPVRADLTLFFPKEAILAALLQNEAIGKALKGADVPTPKTIPALLTALDQNPLAIGDCSFGVEKSLMSSFAFDRVEGDKVAVRFGIPSAIEVCRGDITQIEIMLPISPSLKPQLLAAEDGQTGILMQKAEKIGADQLASFSFSYNNK